MKTVYFSTIKTLQLVARTTLPSRLTLSFRFGHPAAPQESVISQSSQKHGSVEGVDIAQAQEKKGTSTGMEQKALI